MGMAWLWRLFCAALIAASVLSAAPAKAAPIEWTGDGHYYDVVNRSIMWAGAESAAEASSYLGVAGHLVTITSAAEGLWLTNTFGFAALDFHWAGGYLPDGAPPDGWRWVTGEPWVYTNWGPGEPNGYPNENRLDLRDGQTAGGITWNDFRGGGWVDSGYVVEYDVPAPVVPEPSLTALALVGLVGGALGRRASRRKAD